jgi:hypothetical protein
MTNSNSTTGNTRRKSLLGSNRVLGFLRSFNTSFSLLRQSDFIIIFSARPRGWDLCLGGRK